MRASSFWHPASAATRDGQHACTSSSWCIIRAAWPVHHASGLLTAQDRRKPSMTATRMGSLLMSALLMGGLLVPGQAHALTVNQPAPDFTLPSTTGDPIRLSQFRGKKMVLLEFYGTNFDYTGPKIVTARMIDSEAFKALDIEILGISVDEAFAQQTFAESLGLPFPLLSDTDATVTHLYGSAKLIPAGTDLAPVMLPGKGVQVPHDRI